MTRIAVKVTPKAARDAVRGWLEETLRVSVRAAPERGRANDALEAVLATALGVARTRVRVVAGHTGTRKQVEIDGVDGAEVRSRLEAAVSARPV